MSAKQRSAIGPGLSDPVRDAQASFRAILDAFARPGQVADLAAPASGPEDLDPAAQLALLTLVDYETPVFLPEMLAAGTGRWLTFHTGARIVSDPGSAAFAVAPGAIPPRLADLDPGEDRYPDKSATLILLCTALDGGPRMTLSGPGIAETTPFAPTGLATGFWTEWAANHARFPLGVDVIFVAGRRLAALPRSIAARAAEGAR